MDKYYLYIKKKELDCGYVESHREVKKIEPSNRLMGVFFDEKKQSIEISSSEKLNLPNYHEEIMNVGRTGLLEVTMGILPYYNINSKKYKNQDINSLSVDSKGNFSPFIIENNQLKYILSQKNVIDVEFSHIINDVSSLTFERKLRTISYNSGKINKKFNVVQVTFLLRVLNSKKDSLFDNIVTGIGVKKSYGFSRLRFLE